MNFQPQLGHFKSTQGPFAVGLSVVVFESQSSYRIAILSIQVVERHQFEATPTCCNYPCWGKPSQRRPRDFLKVFNLSFFCCDLQHFCSQCSLKKRTVPNSLTVYVKSKTPHRGSDVLTVGFAASADRHKLEISGVKAHRSFHLSLRGLMFG